MSDNVVTMTCMTTKQKFEVTNPSVVVLSNGRYAYRCPCPWTGKDGKELFAFKFCSAEAYRRSQSAEDNPTEKEAAHAVEPDTGPESSPESGA